MTKLQKEGWYLVQIFPEAANVTMVHDANYAGIRLEIMLLTIFGVVLVLLIHFYRKERKNIEEIAEERGEYKNAVLADAIIVFEANLTKNRIWEGTWKNKAGNRVSMEELLGIHLPCDYETYVAQWAETYVDEGARELFLKNTDRMYLKQQFEQGKSEITFEYYAKSPEGEKIFVRRSTYLAADKKNGDIIAYNNVKDITEQKQRENQIRQYEQMLVMTASEMYRGVRQVDLEDFSTVYLSFADNHIIPYDKGDWNTWLDRQEHYIHPDDIEKVKEKLCVENLLKMPVGGSFRCDYRSKGKNQNGFHRVYSTSVFKAERDGKLYASLVTMDNTASIENEMRQKALIEDALLRAESASKAKTKFLSDMSHDIRTPMNAIIGFTTLAMTHINNKERVRDYLEKIDVSSNHLLSLINDVLDMSRIESGRIHLEETECNLLDVMNELEKMLAMEMQSRNLQFSIDTEDIVDGQIICDRLRLNQILLNLLGNTMKFTDSGGSISVQIIEKPEKDGDKTIYEFHVKDTGIGMTEEFQTHIFDSFTREDSKRVQKTEGTGLGMAITKYIVDAMGGEIEVNSTHGVGTEFNVTLDFERTTDHEEDMILPDFTMLVVDDDQQLCESTTTSLKSIGIQADWTLDGESAIQMVKKHHIKHDDYHIILLDWKLPGMDGIETARELRKQLGNDVPILLISAYDWSEIEVEAREAGISGFLSKPLFRSTLYYGLKPYIDSPEKVSVPEKDTITFTDKRVLLAEDNDLNWEIASELLQEFGLELDRAENGQICADMFEKSPVGYYDAILMDIRMPVKNGYEATDLIRNMDRPDASLPIIAMTADAFSEDIQKCLDYGMNAHIAKPIDIKELSRLLNRYFEVQD